MAHVSVEERRPQLVEAAVRVISREGVARATTRRIAAEAGAPLASLHYSFRDKEELFAAVTTHALQLTEQAIAETSIAPGSGLTSAVAELVVLFRDWVLTDPDLHVAQYELQMWALRSPGHHDLAGRCHRELIETLTAVLGPAAAPDEGDVDVGRLARLTVVATDGISIQVLALGPGAVEDVDPARLAAGLVDTARRTPSSGTVD